MKNASNHLKQSLDTATQSVILVAYQPEHIMQVIVHTKVGTFYGAQQSVSEEQMEALKDMLKTLAGNGEDMVLGTQDGYIVLGRAALENAVFEVKN